MFAAVCDAVDVLFLIDGSSTSLSASDFQNAKDFSVSVLQQLAQTSGKDYLFAGAEYSSTLNIPSTPNPPFSDDVGLIESNIQGLLQTDGFTSTSTALSQAATLFRAFGRDNNGGLIILVTDDSVGGADPALSDVLAELVESSVEVVVVAVAIDPAMANPFVMGQTARVFSAFSYAALVSNNDVSDTVSMAAVDICPMLTSCLSTTPSTTPTTACSDQTLPTPGKLL